MSESEAERLMELAQKWRRLGRHEIADELGAVVEDLARDAGLMMVAQGGEKHTAWRALKFGADR